MLRDAGEGHLCPEAVDAVLAAAGHRVAKRPRELPAGLTDRELEVLLALAAGKTNKEIAETLGISPKTAGHHVPNRSYGRVAVLLPSRGDGDDPSKGAQEQHRRSASPRRGR